MENNSGQGHLASVPAELDRWNWGAFLLNWIWGIGNNTFIALLMFVPFVNLVMPFILGAKGSSWAWRNKRWESIDHFKQVQRQWAKWGLIVYLLLIAFFVALFFAIMASLKSSDAYKLAVQAIQSNERVLAVLGEPVSTGMPLGSIYMSGPDGSANLSFSVNGSKQSGTLYLEAVKRLGHWDIQNAVLELDGNGERINIFPEKIGPTGFLNHLRASARLAATLKAERYGA
ncbi:MAG TPA: cytochrome c oxidase assembly factor Coa1 family protein [Rhodocyclaceae bacterium]|nr:cytochrome c oxidase assembly factor Coa1 family protein [Rhodocyclaceae bacterium]